MASAFAIVPVEGESYEGRQWGYLVTASGEPYLHVTTGGTGTCWNVGLLDGEPESEPLHVCDLEKFVAALTGLLCSGEHAAHCARWGDEPFTDVETLRQAAGMSVREMMEAHRQLGKTWARYMAEHGGPMLSEPKLTSVLNAPPGAVERQAEVYRLLIARRWPRPSWWRRIINRARRLAWPVR